MHKYYSRKRLIFIITVVAVFFSSSSSALAHQMAVTVPMLLEEDQARHLVAVRLNAKVDPSIQV